MADQIKDGSNNINSTKMETNEEDTQSSKIDDIIPNKIIDDISSNKIIDHNKMIRDQIRSIVSIYKIVPNNINHFNTTQVAIDQWITSQAKKKLN